MKITIIIENGKTEIQVDDGQAIALEPKVPAFEPITTEDRKKVYSYHEPKKRSERACEVCGNPFMPKRHDSHFCSTKCSSKHHNAKFRKKEKPAAPVEEDVKFCKYCQAWTTHDSANHPAEPAKPELPAMLKEPEFLPGHEKSQEEIKSWEPIVPGSPGYGSAPRNELEERRKP